MLGHNVQRFRAWRLDVSGQVVRCSACRFWQRGASWVMSRSCTPQRPWLNLAEVFGCSASSAGQSRGPLITPGRSHLGGCTLAAVSCVLREPMPLFRRGQVAGLVCYWSHSVRRRGRRPTVYRGEFAISLGRKNSLRTNDARWKTCVERSRHRGRLRLSTLASKATRCLPRTEISPNLRY